MNAHDAYLLYFLFALGAAGLYLAMPSAPRRSSRMAGLVLGVGAIVGGLMLLGMRLAGDSVTNLFFYLFAGVALFCAAKVVTHANPVYSAVYFVAVAVAVAGLALLQGAEFLAIALIIVYAGAILVTYAFVIMLAQQPRLSVYDTRAREPLAGVLVGFVMLAALAGQTAAPSNQPALMIPADGVAVSAGEGNTVAVGESLMAEYVVVLQLAGLLLLIGMVGAVGLVRKRVPRDVPAEPSPPPGEIGKRVKPF